MLFFAMVKLVLIDLACILSEPHVGRGGGGPIGFYGLLFQPKGSLTGRLLTESWMFKRQRAAHH